MYSVHGVVQKVLPLLLCALLPVVEAQYRGRRSAAGTATSTPLPIKGLSVNFQGTVKKLTKKELLLESDDNRLLTMRCSKKTKFRDDDGEIKWSEVDLESRVSVEASEDNDLKLLALSVKVESAPKKTLGK
jgi:hypothetical protein